MKHFILFISLLIISNFQSSVGRNYTNKEFAFFNVNVQLSKDFRNELSSFENYINSIQGYEKKGQDKLEGKIYDIVYSYLEENIESRFKINILPINTFTSNVKYNVYNYPCAKIRRAQKYGNSNYYLKLNVLIETTIPQDYKSSLLYKYKTRPKVTITLEIYDREGLMAKDKAVGTAVALSAQKVDEAFFRGVIVPIDKSEIPDLDENLYALLIKAMEQLLNNF